MFCETAELDLTLGCGLGHVPVILQLSETIMSAYPVRANLQAPSKSYLLTHHCPTQNNERKHAEMYAPQGQEGETD